MAMTMASEDDKRITVGMTGASGAQYGLRLIECLVKADYQVLVPRCEPW